VPRLDPRLTTAAKTVNGEIADRAIRHSLFLERFKTSETNKIVGLLNKQVLPDILDRVEKHIGKGNFTEKRLNDLAVSVDKVANSGYTDIRKVFKGDMQDLSVSEARWQVSAIEQSMPIDIDLITPNTQVLRSLAIKQPIQGRFVNDWYKQLAQNTATKVNQSIRLGVAEGQGIESIVRRLKGTRANGFRDGILDESRRHLRTLVRTSVTEVTNVAREQVFKENTDVIKGVQYIATLDGRTTHVCASLDGQVFPVDDGPRPPQHPQCRSVTAPVMKSWQELGIPLKEIPPSTRASMDGQVASNQTFSYSPFLNTF